MPESQLLGPGASQVHTAVPLCRKRMKAICFQSPVLPVSCILQPRVFIPETGSHIIQDDLELTQLPPPPKCWNFRCVCYHTQLPRPLVWVWVLVCMSVCVCVAVRSFVFWDRFSLNCLYWF